MQEFSLTALLLRFGEWMEEQAFHAPGERIRQVGELEEIFGTRQKKSPGASIRIHRSFDRKQQTGHPLYLIQGQNLRQLRDNPRRIDLRGLKEILIIETEIVATRDEMLRER